MTSKTLLITGATGFIGGHLLAHLQLQANTTLKILLRNADQTDFGLANNCIPCAGDLSQPEALEQACSRVDTIFHLAAISHVNASQRQAIMATNFQGTSNLLAAAVSQGVRRIVYFSSSLASHCEPGNKKANTSDAGEITDYGLAKYQSELLLLSAQQKNEIEIVILRPVNVYGVGMKGNILRMIAGIKAGTFPPLPELNNKISLMGVQDLVRAAMIACDHELASGKIYTLTDGQTYGSNGIEVAIYQTLGRKMPIIKCPRMLLYAVALGGEFATRVSGGRINSPGLRSYRNLVQDNFFCNTKAREELGFEPTTTLYKELPGIVKFLENQQIN